MKDEGGRPSESSPTRRTWRFILIGVVALVVALFLVVAVLTPDAVCDGWYDVTVQFAPEYDHGATSLSYVCCNKSELADAIVGSLDDYLAGEATHKPTVAPFDIRVGFSYHSFLFGRTSEEKRQYSEIVLVLQRADGTRIVHRLPIPDRNDTRRIIVTASSAI